MHLRRKAKGEGNMPRQTRDDRAVIRERTHGVTVQDPSDGSVRRVARTYAPPEQHYDPLAVALDRAATGRLRKARKRGRTHRTGYDKADRKRYMQGAEDRPYRTLVRPGGPRDKGSVRLHATPFPNPEKEATR
jgi:hypothetical protein